MDIFANQDRESERSDCDEKDDDSIMPNIYSCNEPPPPERIRFIGRTGAGKSSIFNRNVINKFCLHVVKSMKESEELRLRLEKKMKVRREKREKQREELRLLLEEISKEREKREKQREELRLLLEEISKEREKPMEELRLQLEERSKESKELSLKFEKRWKEAEKQREEVRLQLEERSKEREKEREELRLLLEEISKEREKEREELRLQLEERSKEREKQREELRLQLEERSKEGSLGFFGTVKAPTEVMLEKKTHEAFVYEAEDKYKDFDEKGKHEPYFYISQLPMRINKKLEERNSFEEKPNAIKEIKRNNHVGAINFGPTYAANVCYIIHEYEADPDTGFVNDWLYQGGSLATVIKPTVDLVEHDGKTVGAFGREAEDKYKDDYDYGQYLLEKVGKSGPRTITLGGKYSKVWYKRSTDHFDFLAERKRGFRVLPKTDLKKSPTQLWLGNNKDESPGDSKTLLSEPLNDERSETENFNNYSSKTAEQCASAKKQDAIIPAERKSGFLVLPKTDLKKSPTQLWLDYNKDESPGESKTLLSKPLHDERSETENLNNYSSKTAEQCASAKKQDAIIPDNDRLLCKVCYMNELSIVFLPCSHMVACRRCAARLKSCPVCRSGIKEALPADLHE